MKINILHTYIPAYIHAYIHDGGTQMMQKVERGEGMTSSKFFTEIKFDT